MACVGAGLVLVALAGGWGSRGAEAADVPAAVSRAGVHESLEAVQFAEATVAQMRAYHEAHPSVGPTVVPFRDAPRAQAVDLDAPARVVVPDARILDVGEAPAPGAGSVAAPALITSFQGVLDDDTTIPPDTMGAVGPSHIVEILNTGFTVYDKTGALVSAQVSLQAFWSSLGTAAGEPASRPFDPKVLYDQYSGRFVVTADSNPTCRDGTLNSWVLVGISSNSDPTGSWNLYAILANPAGGPHPEAWSDYPGLGVDPNNVIITNNIFPIGFCVNGDNNGDCCDGDNACPGGTCVAGNYIHSDVWVINKATLIAGPGPLVEGTDYALIHDPCQTGGSTFQPCHTFQQTTATAVNYLIDQGYHDIATTTRRFLRVKAITGTGAAASLACANNDDWIEVAGYNLDQVNAPQPNGCTRINTNDPRLLNAVVRHGKLWTTHSVGGSGAIPDPAGFLSKAEVAWYEIDPSVAGAFPGGLPNQQGRVAHADLHYYFPSIAVNAAECVALGFSGSDGDTFVSGYYTVREPVDAAGTMEPVSVLKSGVDTYLKTFGADRNRWGDYSATMVDPVDDLTFWTLQQYAEEEAEPGDCGPETGRWGTWWGSFQCDTVSAPPICDADGPYIVECQGTTTDIGTLDASNSSDPKNDPLTYLWSTDCPGEVLSNPTAQMPTLTVSSLAPCPQDCTAFLTVDDGVTAVSCSTLVRVKDFTVPELDCPETVNLTCSTPEGAPAALADLGVTATDICDPDVTLTDDRPDDFFPPTCGELPPVEVTVKAEDDCGNFFTCIVKVEVFGPMCCPGVVETDLTLMPVDNDFRQETIGPVTTKAKFDIWNQNEVRFSGTARCITCWDQTLLGEYDAPNHFLLPNLHTDKGRARIDGIQSAVCEDVSRATPLLGVAMREIVFAGVPPFVMRSAKNPVGMGFESAQILYDIIGEPGELTGPTDGAASTTGLRIGMSADPLRAPQGTDATRAVASLAGSHRGSVSKKGSVLFWPKVEIKWDAQFNLIQDTFLDLSNDYPGDVRVQLYLVNGDGPTEAVLVGDPPVLAERAHPGWNNMDVEIELTGNQPVYWSALTGQSAGVSAFTVLDPGVAPGRPDTDPLNPGGRVLRGFVIGWAVDSNGEEINWNHLSGDATVVSYANRTAWEYNAWAFQCVSGVDTGEACDAVPGQLNLDGVEYDACPDKLLLDFYATGSEALSHPAVR